MFKNYLKYIVTVRPLGIIIFLFFIFNPITQADTWSESRDKIQEKNNMSSFEFVMSASADLNGDGKAENISVSEISDLGDYQLSVNQISIDGKLGPYLKIKGVVVIDIDTTDAYKEIAIHAPGYGSDLYGFDGTKIIKIGRLGENAIFPGDGTITTGFWSGYWLMKVQYEYTSDRVLKVIPQEFSFVGVDATVKEPFPIFEKRDSEKIVKMLEKDSRVHLILTNFAANSSPTWHSDDVQNRWFLVKAPDGVVGWMKYKNAVQYLHLPGRG